MSDLAMCVRLIQWFDCSENIPLQAVSKENDRGAEMMDRIRRQATSATGACDAYPPMSSQTTQRR